MNTLNIKLISLALLILSFPMAIAAQTIASGIVILITIAVCFKNRNQETFKDSYSHLLKHRLPPIVLGAAFLLLHVLASSLNEKNAGAKSIDFLIGSIPWLILPPLAFLAFKDLTSVEWKKLSFFGVFIVGLWGLIATSQYIWGWQLLDISIAPDVQRPRGLYPHPLTLAYAALLVWPFAVSHIFLHPQKVTSWIWCLSVGAILVFTQSRTVQVLGLMVLGWNFMSYFSRIKRRDRYILLLLGFALVTITLTTHNIVTDKFKKTFTTEGVDKFSSYPDDRLAFWHAHALMIKERPILGHGINLDTSYREPYYESLGLKDFPKKYEAHNMFIQITAETGLLGLFLFIGWLSWHLWFFCLSRFKVPPPFTRLIILQTLVIFILGGLTQNAFQDFEVRVGLTLFCILVWLAPRVIKKAVL